MNYEIPEFMHAWTLRTERLGNVETAFADEMVRVPKLKPSQVLVANMSAGINYNGIWAARGKPKNVIESNGLYGDRQEDFHITGSESSGIVVAVGEKVKNLKVGDEVCVFGHRYLPDCPHVKAGLPPEYSPTAHIWGYESNWGAFAEYSPVYDFQCVPKPKFMNWNEASVCTATGVTIYRMLFHWKGNELQKGDVVLIWGGSGGLGSYAIQMVRAYGGIPVAVVSDDAKGEYCVSLGAEGYINRKKYCHWGSIAGMNEKEYQIWLMQAGKFRNEIFSITGKRSPAIVIEHPGSDTLATSLLVCKDGGMVVLCGATTGYISSIDLRYLWIHQKRIQGSHGGTTEDCRNFLTFSEEHEIKPILYKVYHWSGLPKAHADLEKGEGIKGKLAVNIGLDKELKK